LDGVVKAPNRLGKNSWERVVLLGIYSDRIIWGFLKNKRKNQIIAV